MLARMTITVKLDDTLSEQFTAMLQLEDIPLEDFKMTVQDSFGAGFISNLSTLFKKLEDRVKEREAEKEKKEKEKIEVKPQLGIRQIELTKQEPNEGPISASTPGTN